MAEIFPSFENIERLKVKPDSAEKFLLKYLVDNLSSDYEVYFQPFLNGDMPDIIVMRRNAGVIIIEVKEMNLGRYYIDENNKWFVTDINQGIRSPMQQVFGYKSNMFRLHISGLAEKNVMNKNFFRIIKPFTYFHGATKTDLKNLYEVAEKSLRKAKQELNESLKNKKIKHEAYDKRMDYLEKKSRQLSRDRNIAIYGDTKHKILNALREDHVLFKGEIYDEFKRYLQPPLHVASQGIEITYDKVQTRLVKSQPGFMKIKGVAGCGKTTVLAKRAVNALMRHDEKVLIFVYNKTLRNLIRDRISDVREDFTWDKFGITTFHSYMAQMFNYLAIPYSPPENVKEVSVYFDNLFSNENVFDGYENELENRRFSTIFIDEVQDYRPEWIKIIRKYFLATGGEMVLFGDESQNIYNRDITIKKPAIVQGFGEWQRLRKSYRSKAASPLTAMTKSFQHTYLEEKYDIDLVESTPSQSDLSFDVLTCSQFEDASDAHRIYENVFTFLKGKSIHPNDVTIISSKVDFLRKLDEVIRVKENEDTKTTFEREDVYLALEKEHGKNTNDFMREIDSIRDSKKFSFNANSGHLKLSTVHSFKGLESSTVIFIALEDDSDEMTYTGITRAKTNSILFVHGSSKYLEFFQRTPSMELLQLKN